MAKKMSFKGHNSFHLREGWVTKVLEQEDLNIFRADILEQSEVLGIGSTMVKSLRFYATAMNLIKNTTKQIKFTELGEVIKKNDLYLEQNKTLFVLFYELARNEEKFTSLNVLFNELDFEYMTKIEIIEYIRNRAQEDDEERSIPIKSIESDIACIQSLLNYERKDKKTPEDNYISPFSDLNLIKIDSKNRIRKSIPDLAKLDRNALLYAILRQKTNSFDKAVEINDHMSVEAIVSDRNSVGRLLNLDRATVFDYLEKLQNDKYIKVENTAGLDQIYFKKEISALNVLY